MTDWKSIKDIFFKSNSCTQAQYNRRAPHPRVVGSIQKVGLHIHKSRTEGGYHLDTENLLRGLSPECWQSCVQFSVKRTLLLSFTCLETIHAKDTETNQTASFQERLKLVGNSSTEQVASEIRRIKKNNYAEIELPNNDSPASRSFVLHEQVKKLSLKLKELKK